ncbi:hypothetical protein [Candidatus Nitrosocosmicus sp. R]
MQLFLSGKTPIEVKIELDMTTEEVERLYKDYRKLLGLYKLYNYYINEIKEDLPSFLKLFKEVKDLWITNEDIISSLRYIHQLPWLAIISKKM